MTKVNSFNRCRQPQLIFCKIYFRLYIFLYHVTLGLLVCLKRQDAGVNWGVEMFEYSWMLVFVAINGLLTVGEMDTKEEGASAAAQMEQVGTEGITGNFACIPAPNYIAEGSAYE